MTKCLLKALKAVDLDKHVELFRALGYDSAGALAHFRTEHFEKLNFTEPELLHLISLIDVLKEAARDGKICSHQLPSAKQQSNVKPPATVRASWCDENSPRRSSQPAVTRPSTRSKSSTDVLRRSSAQPTTSHLEQFIPSKPPTTLHPEHFSIPIKTGSPNGTGPKSFLNRPLVEHVKVKSYNYGVPTNRRSRSQPSRSIIYQHELNPRHASMFASSSHHNTDAISYAKPAEIYVYARKRPLLSSEKTFEDTIVVPDNQRVIIAENKANLDCTPLLKKTEFQFDQVFGADASNRQVFEATVLPFISTDHRHNLTYICFGQTGSGKSHTIFGSKTIDGLLIYCTQLLLQEVDDDNKLSCSFYEIYNNQVYDLVNGGKRLFVREDGDHHVNIIGITEFLLKSLDNLRCVIDEGLARRHHGKSAFNAKSSRSHAVFQITLHCGHDPSENFRLIFIDLAGSERATDAQNNLRQTRREGAQINWSLLALKECIRSMDLTHSHAPFRQSKLTHILRDSLVGSKTRTCLMANVSPPSDCCQCSLNTLQYASRIRGISIRHRHRTILAEHVRVDAADDDDDDDVLLNDADLIVPEKPQRSFKPATASTPVHRLISSADARIYSPSRPAGSCEGANARKTKPVDIGWQMADDDLPITGSGSNRLIKSLASSKRDSKLTFHTNAPLQSNNRHINRLHAKKTNDFASSPSSYFPMPQADIKKPSVHTTTKHSRVYESSRLMYDDGNERRWKPTSASLAHRFSGSSTDAPIATRATSMPTVVDPHPSGTAATESLGTKITKAAVRSRRHRKSSAYNDLVESLNLNKYSDSADAEPMIQSDRQATYRDQTGFFTNRDELLSIVSNRLTSAGQRPSTIATPKKTKGSASNPLHSSKSKNVYTSSSSTNRAQPKSHSTKPAVTLTGDNPMKKFPFDSKKSKVTSSWDPTTRYSSTSYQQSIPLRVPHSSDSDDSANHHRASLTRSEACQTTNEFNLTNNGHRLHQPAHEQKPMTTHTEPLSSLLLPTTTTLHPSLISPPLTGTSAPTEKPWLLSSSFGSPSKEFAERVSDQLNALRNLLETHLVEPTPAKPSPKAPSERPLSPSSFAREFLKSCRQPSLKTNTIDLLSDDDDREVASSLSNPGLHVKLSSPPPPSSNQNAFLFKHHYEQIIEPSLSSLTAKLNQAKLSAFDAVPASSATTVLETKETQVKQAESPRHPSSNEHHLATELGKSTSENELTSQVHLDEPNGTGSLRDSPLVLPPFSTLDSTSRIDSTQEKLFDHEKAGSLLNTSPFNTLLNSLKSMRDKDLDFVVHTGDDQLIPVAD